MRREKRKGEKERYEEERRREGVEGGRRASVFCGACRGGSEEYSALSMRKVCEEVIRAPHTHTHTITHTHMVTKAHTHTR